METQLFMKLPTQLPVWKPCTMLCCTSLMQTRATMGCRSTLQPERQGMQELLKKYILKNVVFDATTDYQIIIIIFLPI